MAGVTVIRGTGDDVTVADVKAASPHTLCIERWFWNDGIWRPHLPDFQRLDHYQEGRDFVDAYLARFSVDRSADYIQMYNEPAYGPGFPSWVRGQISRSAELGIKLVVCNFSTDNPPLEFWDTDEAHAMIRDIIRYDMVLGLHEYEDNAPNGRWDTGMMTLAEAIVARLPDDCKGVKIWHNEYGMGYASSVSTEAFITKVKQAFVYLTSGIANVICASLWCAGDWWADVPDKQGNHHVPNDNWAGHAQALLAWMLSV